MKEKIKEMKNKLVSFILENKKICIPISIAIILLIVLIIVFVCTRTERGNTNSNLTNLGFSLEDAGWVYYLNNTSNEESGIYKVRKNGENNQKLNDAYGFYINKVGKYLYYIDSENYNLVKMNANDGTTQIIEEDVEPEKIYVENNWIYYFDESNLCKIKTNGNDKKILLNRSIENYEVKGNWIFYSYINDGKITISKMNLNGDKNEKIDTDLGKVFSVNGNNIYYIYETYNEQNNNYTYELYRIKTNGKDKEKIGDLDSNIDLDTINFNGHKIYYTKTDENGELGIYSIGLDGKEEIKITNIKEFTTLINVFGDWIYYPDKDEDGKSKIFKIRTNGNDKQSLS